MPTKVEKENEFMRTMFSFYAHHGRREYCLVFIIKDFDGQRIIEENKVKLFGKDWEIVDIYTHKDWTNAFSIDTTDDEFTTIEFKKGFTSLEVDSIVGAAKGLDSYVFEGLRD